MITVSNVDSAQSVEITAVGSGSTNRLFVFTGIAQINFDAGDNDDLHTDHAFLDVSFFHGNTLFDPDSAATTVAAIAWPAGMHATDDADQTTWAVDTSSSSIAADGRLTLDVVEIDEIKTVSHAHPFVERLIGAVRREFLDQMLFWNARDLERKLTEFQTYNNAARSDASLAGDTPLAFALGHTAAPPT